jgi:hypothetical protein
VRTNCRRATINSLIANDKIINGGLGNQMFQYALGRNLSPAGTELALDISVSMPVRLRYPRRFALQPFSIKARAVELDLIILNLIYLAIYGKDSS